MGCEKNQALVDQVESIEEELALCQGRLIKRSDDKEKQAAKNGKLKNKVKSQQEKLTDLQDALSEKEITEKNLEKAMEQLQKKTKLWKAKFEQSETMMGANEEKIAELREEMAEIRTELINHRYLLFTELERINCRRIKFCVIIFNKISKIISAEFCKIIIHFPNQMSDMN